MSNMEQEMRLVLASASPRRRQLLAEAGYRFDVTPSGVEEDGAIDEARGPEHMAQALAYLKARDVARHLAGPAVVLGADTVVACQGEILGKGRDADHARQMLFTLSRTRHCVVTGVALVRVPAGRVKIEADVSWITMRPMSEGEIDEYIASGAWRDKAGSYGVQEGADRFITRIDGSYSNVVGLPMELVKRMLSEFEIHAHVQGGHGSE